jgi:anti-anti-sigma factor
MVQPKLEVVIREPADRVRVLDLRGPISRSAQEPLKAAYQEASSGGVDIVILNFSEVESMDSYGLGLLIALLARAQHQKQRLVACGPSTSLRMAFTSTYLDEALPVYIDEVSALAGPTEAPAAQELEDCGAEPQREWARPVERLSVPALPTEAINLNIRGRRPTGPMRGFGPLWLRTYQIKLAGAAATPAEVVRIWRERFASFWPPGSRFYGADRPIQTCDVGVLNLAGPAGTTIATGIRVIYTDEESFCFLSVEGHMFGGMITFGAYEEDGTTVAQVQAMLRSSDPVYELGQRFGFAVEAEDRFWQGTLTNLAAHFGVEDEPVRQESVVLDPTIQWSRAANIWYNAAIRTTLYLPIRWVRRLFAR